MFELVLIAALAGGFGLTADANPVNVQIEFSTLERCAQAGNDISSDLKAKGMVILESRCVKTRN